MSPLRWTRKHLRRLAAELEKIGHKVSHTVVGELLKKQKFSLQADRKTEVKGADNPDRDRQFGSSTTRSRRRWPRTSRPYPSIRRRNWSAISRTPAAIEPTRQSGRGARA